MYVRTGLGDVASAALLGSGISAGVGLATSGLSLWLSSINLSHQADTATTQIVNGLAPKLQALHDAYLAGPGTCADQAAAMAAYLTAVNWLYSTAGCGNGAYGSAGNRCISDRFGPGGPTDANAKFPWAAYYYWPIANDPRASDCAAQLALSNPDAGLQSAITNLQGGQQTTPGSFGAGGVLSPGVAAATGAFSLSTPFLGFPIWAWAAGIAAIAILK